MYLEGRGQISDLPAGRIDRASYPMQPARWIEKAPLVGKWVCFYPMRSAPRDSWLTRKRQIDRSRDCWSPLDGVRDQLQVGQGGVLVMRPLLLHASSKVAEHLIESREDDRETLSGRDRL
jgi:hypothetical protein